VRSLARGTAARLVVGDAPGGTDAAAAVGSGHRGGRLAHRIEEAIEAMREATAAVA
jgi:hypothetical protein